MPKLTEATRQHRRHRLDAVAQRLGVDALILTDEGLRAVGIDPNEDNAVADTAPTVAPAA